MTCVDRALLHCDPDSSRVPPAPLLPPLPACVRSGEHCKICSSSDEDRDVYLYDLSCNGTYVNGKLVGKDSRQPLKAGDTVTLLDPAKPNHYQFIFQDLRPALPPPAPVQLLQNTSFCAGGGSEDMGSPSHYDEVSELGRGAFAVVKKVVHRKTGRELAMKSMEKKKLPGQLRRKPGGEIDDAIKEKILAEARILKTLSHPNIIKYWDMFETERELCLVMELVDGGELFDYLVDNGPCSEPDARCIMRQLLQALQYLHSRNIVHRDLKPENILLERAPHADGSPSSSPAPPNVKIADFGLAKLVGEKKVTSTFCGTPQYFAPEVLESRDSHRGYDSACDLWSVGVIMYILLSGSPPFDETRPSAGASAPTPSIFDQIKAGITVQEHLSGEAWKGVSDAAKHLVSKLLVVSPKHRITVDKALSHNWMKGIDEADSPTLFRLSSSETSSGGPTDEIDDFSDEEEWRNKDESKRHAAAVPAAPAKRVKATLDLGPDSAQALRPTPLQGRANTQSRQPPVPPPTSKPPPAFKPTVFNNNNSKPAQFKLPHPQAKQPRPSAKPAANLNSRVNPLGFTALPVPRPSKS